VAISCYFSFVIFYVCSVQAPAQAGAEVTVEGLRGTVCVA
jgi:hypothetical protein